MSTLLDSWPLSHGFSVYLGNGEHNTRTRSVAVMHSDVYLGNGEHNTRTQSVAVMHSDVM